MNATSDVLIIGSGVIGLAIAVELKLRSCSVTVLSRDFHAAAAHAAAGMLAPQAEAMPSGPMQSLCLQSRSLYADWVRKLEELTGQVCGYWPCGILAPVYEGYGVEVPGANGEMGSPSSPQLLNSSVWLGREAIHQCQPGLGPDVVGGWWHPEDGQVDNRALTKVLWTAAQLLGVDIRDGVTVEAIQQQQRQVVGVQTSDGIYCAAQYVLATGAWSNSLLPLPVRPKKGQMLSVQTRKNDLRELPLQRILFGSDIYIVPRLNRQIVIGATSEEVGFTPHNTPAGIQSLLEQAIRLYPQLQQYPIQEFWWGFRPATPDELPILGPSPCQNLTLAVGHYRNGILLAPVTAALIADLVSEQKAAPILNHFHYSRFYQARSASPPHPFAFPPSPFPLHPLLKMQTLNRPTEQTHERPLIIAGRTFQSRLMTGTGKYPTLETMQQSVAASGCQIVTVAVRRVQTNAPGHEGLAEALDWQKIWMLPNTAGCKTAEEAIRVARLGREMAKLLGQEDNNFVKLEVIPDPKYLLPDPIGTLEAAEQLVKEGFAVLPYINADPILAKRLEDVGCATVMPLGSPIGSGQGLKNAANIEIIIENAKVPVVVDAGIRTPSEAAQAMELGADAVLINSAIALAENPVVMAHAMSLATEAGRLAYLAGRIPVKVYASASSPLAGTVTS